MQLRAYLLNQATATIAAMALAPSAFGEAIEISSALLSIAEEVNVSAETEGVLKRLDVREGSRVRRGQVIAQISADRLALAQSRTRIESRLAQRAAEDDVDVRHADKTRDLAIADLARAEAINEKIPNTVSVREMTRLKLATEVAALDLERALRAKQNAGLEASLKQVELQITDFDVTKCAIVSPIDGMVVLRRKRAGEWVRAGDEVVRLVRVDRVRAEGFLAASKAPLSLVGQRAKLRVELSPGRRQEAIGKVSFVSPQANPLTSQVKIWAEFEVADLALRPGLRGHVWIESRPAAKGAAQVQAAPSAAAAPTERQILASPVRALPAKH